MIIHFSFSSVALYHDLCFPSQLGLRSYSGLAVSILATRCRQNRNGVSNFVFTLVLIQLIRGKIKTRTKIAKLLYFVSFIGINISPSYYILKMIVEHHQGPAVQVLLQMLCSHRPGVRGSESGVGGSLMMQMALFLHLLV